MVTGRIWFLIFKQRIQKLLKSLSMRRTHQKVRALQMSGEKISRIKPFNEEEWLKWKDIERCPYSMYDEHWASWSKRDDIRLMLIALDRFADYLQGVDSGGGNNPTPISR